MKSLGITVYLAHAGMPVPASSMKFPVKDGLYTTINLADDLHSGNSHFYAEVLRLKKVSREAGLNKQLVIIFDELFRGTNVKDACDATIAVTEAFSTKEKCLFVISTHIVEAGDALEKSCSSVNFISLPSSLVDNKPVYTYKLAAGISADRHGMIIINNEGIIDIIRSHKFKNSQL